MKALYITNLGLMTNLAGSQILPYIEGLAGSGIRMTILSYERPESLRDRERVRRMKGYCKERGIRWHRLVYHRRWGNVWDVIVGTFTVIWIILTEGPNVLHARATVPIIIAWPIAKITGRKVIYDRRGTIIGDLVDDVNVRNVFSMRIFEGMLNAFDHFLVAHSDATVVLSIRAVDQLMRVRGMRKRNLVIENISCSASIEKFIVAPENAALPELRERFVICYLGSLGTCYMFEEMARFFKVFKRHKDNAFFLILSNNDPDLAEEILKKNGQEKGKDYSVFGVPHEEIPRYLAACDASLMFIKPVECKIGSSPTKFGESLAAGVPVMINKGIGDTEDILRDNPVGVIIDSFEERSYEDAAKKILELDEDREDTRKHCVRVAKQFFSMTTAVDKYIGIYRRITAKKVA